MKPLPPLLVEVTNEEEGGDEAAGMAEESVGEGTRGEGETKEISANVMTHGLYRILMATEWRCIQHINSMMMNGIKSHKLCNSSSYT